MSGRLRPFQEGRAFLEQHKETLLHTATETVSRLADEELQDLGITLKKPSDMLSELQ